MKSKLLATYKNEPSLIIAIVILLFVSLMMLRSLAPGLFPQYFIYIFVAILAFIIFSSMDFELLSLFNKHLYVLSIGLLIFTFIIGQVTRGVVRWIQIGSFSFQPTEIVRPFIILFFANYLTSIKLTHKNIIKAGILVAIPLFLIVIQPSLGVTVLTF